jgi:prepilin-type N-terminal cleavage/methylation domain-containing protein
MRIDGRRPPHRAGVSLVELLVGLVVAGVVGAVAYNTFVRSNDSQRSLTAQAAAEGVASDAVARVLTAVRKKMTFVPSPPGGDITKFVSTACLTVAPPRLCGAMEIRRKTQVTPAVKIGKTTFTTVCETAPSDVQTDLGTIGLACPDATPPCAIATKRPNIRVQTFADETGAATRTELLIKPGDKSRTGVVGAILCLAADDAQAPFWIEAMAITGYRGENGKLRTVSKRRLVALDYVKEVLP